jgi:predicted RND superfamily exporter protein
MLKKLYPSRYFILVFILILAALNVSNIQKAIVVDNSLEVWFLQDDPSVVDYNQFKQKFGNDEIIMLMLKDKQSMLNKEQSSKLQKLSKALRSIQEVKAVFSAADQEIIEIGLFGPQKKKLVETYKEEGIRTYFNNNTSLKDQYYSKDELSTRLIIVLKNIPNFDAERGRIIKTIKQEADNIMGEHSTFWGGIGIIYEGLNALSAQDFGRFLGLGYLAMFIIILLLYRSIWVVLHALLTVSLSTYFCLALYGAMGYQLNIMTSLLPTIFVLLGVMDTLHIYNERNNLIRAGNTKTESAFSAMAKEIRPCLFTSLTTMAGFLALLSSPMSILKSFGFFAAFGIALCFVFTYLLGLFFLPKANAHSPSELRIVSALLKIENLVIRKKEVVIGMYVLLFGLCIIGINRIETDTETMSYFPREHEVIRDHYSIENSFGAYMPLELSIESKNGELFSSSTIQKCNEFSDYLITNKIAEKANGYYTFLQETNRFLPSNLKDDTTLNYSKSAYYFKWINPTLYQYYVHDSSHTARITLFGKIPSASELTKKSEAALSIADSIFGKNYIIKAGGYQPMYSKIANYTVQSQVYSIIIAFVAIFILIWLFIRDFKLALVAIITNSFPIACIFGTMGLLNYQLDLATASIAAICLSFCVDDTIHYIFHYKRIRSTEGLHDIRNKTLKHVGAAIVMTSIVLFAGYILLLFGSLKTVYYFGLLTSIAIATALLAQLTLQSVLLYYMDKK